MAIRHKRKSSADYTWLSTDLVDGQIGINTVDGTLHILLTDNSVRTIPGDISVAWGDITGTLSDQTDLQTALDAKADDTDIANLQTQIDTNATNIGINASNITTNANDIATNVTDIATNASNITSLQGQVNSNTNDIVTLTNDVSDNATDIATNTGDISTNTSDISQLQTDVGDNTTNITQLQTDVGTNTTDIADNTTNITTNQNAIIQLQTDVGTNTSNIATNTTDIAGKEDSLGNPTLDGYVLASTAAGIRFWKVDEAGTDENAVWGNITGTLSDQTDLQNALDAINTQVSTNTSNISTNSGDIVTLQADVGTNASNIASNTSSIATNTGDILANAGNISTNTTNISNNTSAIATNSTDIATNATNIGTNSTDIATLQTSKEDALGNPASDGFVLSSLVDGTRSWIYQDAPDRVRWLNEWVNASYKKNDMVIDGNWTMIANKDTSDRPAPQPDLSQPAAYLIEDTLVFPELINTSVIFSGQKYTFTHGGWVSRIRVQIPTTSATTTYRLMIIDDTNPAEPVVNIFDQAIVDEDEWILVAVGERVVYAGSVFRIFIDALDTATETITQATYTNGGEDKSGDPPPTGSWTRNKHDEFYFDKTDADGTDRSALLASIIPETIIRIEQSNDSTQYWDLLVRGQTADNGSYRTIYVDRLVNEGNPEDGEPTTVTFTVPTPAPTQYHQEDDYWLTNQPTWGTVEGILAYDGVWQTGVEDNAYSVDVLFQPGTSSEDWDLVATSVGGGAGASEGDNIEIIDNLTSTNPAAALSANMGRELNVTKAPTVHTHAISDVTNLQSELDNKSDITHTHAIDDLSDVVITTPAANEVLTYNGTNWINLATPGLSDFASVVVQNPTNTAIPTTWTNIDWNTGTVIQNNSAILEHSQTNTDRILIKETGLYFLMFSASFDADAGEELVELRALINDATIIPASNRTASEDDEINGISNAITCELTAGSYVTLQVQASGAGNVLQVSSNFALTRAGAVAGAEGPPGPAGGVAKIFQGSNAGVTQTFSAPMTVNMNTTTINDSIYVANTVTGGTEVTINQTGRFRVSYNVSASGNTNTRCISEGSIEINGTTVPGSLTYSYHRNAQAGTGSGAMSTVVDITSGQVLRIRFDSIDNASLTTIAQGCSLTIESIE